MEVNIHESELGVVQKQNTLEYKLTFPWIGKNTLRLFLLRFKGCWFLKHAKDFLPRETLKTLYASIVEPHFRYWCSGCGFFHNQIKIKIH